VQTAVVGFCYAVFALSWAWGSYPWFASAYDEEDWVCRIATMVQMVGVIIVALGLPEVFASLDAAGVLDYRLVVTGYIVMRMPMAVQWLRATSHDRDRRSALLTYIWTITLAQLGWTALLDLAPQRSGGRSAHSTSRTPVLCRLARRWRAWDGGGACVLAQAFR
jgi:low temperature requirement protein LtrA